MSDSVVHCNESAPKTGRSMQSYRSAWVSHWTKKSYGTAVENHICSSSSLGKKELDPENKDYQSITKLETASNSYFPVKGTEKTATRASKVTNESLRMNLTAIRNENLAFHVFPEDVSRQKGERSSGLRDSRETCNHELMKPQIKHSLDFKEPTLSTRRSFIPSLLPVDPDANDTSSRVCHSEPHVPLNANKPVKTLSLFKDGGFAMSRSWPMDATASTSHDVRQGFDDGDATTNLLPLYVDRSLPASKEQLQHTNMGFVERDYQKHSAILVCREKIENQSKAELPESSCLQQDKGLFLQTNPSTNNNHSPAIGGGQLQKIHNFAVFRLSQNQSKSPEVTKSQNLHHGYNSIPKFLHSVHDMETMRICTTVDAVVGLHGGHPRFSQTTHSFLITKKTDFNLNKEDETYENSRGSADGNLFSNIHLLSSSPFGDDKKVALQPMGDFKDGEDEENAENAENVNGLSRFRKVEKTAVHSAKAFGNTKDKGKKVEHKMFFDSNLKNESSAETDVMELDEFEEKNELSGINSPPANKIIKLGSPAPQLALGSTRELGYKQHSSELHGMNFELPPLPASQKMFDSGEPSTSGTQSLDMETLIANAEQFSHSDMERCLGSSAKPEPSGAWVKRLKLSASDSFVGTKSSSLGPSHKKNNLVLARNREGLMPDSEKTVGGHHGKELMLLDKTTALSRGCESFSKGSSKSRDSLLSHSWIRRWRHDQSTNPKTEIGHVLCEPQSSKLALEDLQKKQFPSIAAMALMGKAMRGFQPCQFRKKGSLVVWK